MAGLTVREKERLTPIAGTYDVIVAGGGIAGAATGSFRIPAREEDPPD